MPAGTRSSQATRLRRTPRREFGVALGVGALGAGLALLGARQPWAYARFPAQNPLPGSTVAVTGQDLAPAVAALALAGLACLAAVIATRGLLRSITGLLLAAFGAGISAAAAGGTGSAHVAAAAAASAPAAYGAGVRATGAGLRPEITLAAFPWWAIALAGGLLLVAAGALTGWRGKRWPGMSSRYERPGVPAARTGPGTGSATAGGDAAAGAGRGPDAGAGRGSGARGGLAGPAEAPDLHGSTDPARVWAAMDRGTDPTV